MNIKKHMQNLNSIKLDFLKEQRSVARDISNYARAATGDDNVIDSITGELMTAEHARARLAAFKAFKKDWVERIELVDKLYSEFEAFL